MPNKLEIFKKTVLLIISTSFVYFYGCSNVLAKDLFVSPSGNDSVSYSENDILHPWATPAKAWYNAQAGDTVYFRGGTYYISSTVDTNGSNGHNGTSANPITFTSYNNENPVFIATGGSGVMFQISKDYNVVKDITIDAGGHFGVVFGVGWYNGDRAITGFVADGLTISNWSDGDNHNAFYIGSSCSAITATDVTIKNCTIAGLSSGANQNYSGIQVFGAAHFSIENNDISQVRRGIYIKHSSAGYIDQDDIIINNYVHDLNDGAIGLRINGNYVDVINNLIIGNVEYGEDAESCGTPNGTYITFRHNSFVGSAEQLYDGGGRNVTIEDNLFASTFNVYRYSNNPENPEINSANYNLYSATAVMHKGKAYSLSAWRSHLAEDATGGAARDAHSIAGTPSFNGGGGIQGYELTPDSVGYKAASDGKDIGADVSLVGPGTDGSYSSSCATNPSLCNVQSECEAAGWNWCVSACQSVPCDVSGAPSSPQAFQIGTSLSGSNLAFECNNYETLHPEWIFCDDFEADAPLVDSGRYFEYQDDGGEFIRQKSVGYDNSHGMRALFQAGEVDAGGLLLAFGRNPGGGMNNGIHSTENYAEIYYRLFVKMQAGWIGNPVKLTRASVITTSDWSQAMIAHFWGQEGTNVIQIEPASCVSGDTVVCSGYNDFNNIQWLGPVYGKDSIYSSNEVGTWRCLEFQVKLNASGASDGIQRVWVDGVLDAEKTGLNFVGTYTDYGINYIAFANYWNGGSPQEQARYIDNIVVSTTRIGCQ